MKKFEAPSLEEAYAKAAAHFGCSVTELDVEIVQHPSGGLLGMFKKEAIIVAAPKSGHNPSTQSTSTDRQPIEETVAKEVVATIIEETKEPTPAQASAKQTIATDDAIVDDFFKADKANRRGQESYGDENDVARSIEDSIKHLMDVSCFDIDTVEVDVEGNTAYIFIDGEDAALLIGKEGYRYNALSYMLFNWINAQYGLYIKLEIAQFYTSQQEMMRHMLAPLIEEIQVQGSGRTRFLDGILAQIALEQLREAFPDKYVAIKKSKDGRRFVVVNDFYNRS